MAGRPVATGGAPAVGAVLRAGGALVTQGGLGQVLTTTILGAALGADPLELLEGAGIPEVGIERTVGDQVRAHVPTLPRPALVLPVIGLCRRCGRDAAPGAGAIRATGA